MRFPKRLVGKGENGSHARARRQERELAKKLGGRTVRGSGCGSEKGDVRVERIARIEAKTTKNKSFSVTREMIAKIEEAAISMGEVPALVVEFNDNGKRVADVAIIPTWALEALLSKVSNDDK